MVPTLLFSEIEVKSEFFICLEAASVRPRTLKISAVFRKEESP